MTKFEAINWNQIANRVDYSAWSRLNDFIWEPERIPVFKDKKEFESLGDDVKEAVLRAFAALAFLSTIQVKFGDDATKQDTFTSQGYSVYTALCYLEAIANKSYSNVIQNLANPSEINSYFTWVNEQETFQKIASKYLDIYKNGEWWQRKIALSFMEMALYHVGFYASLRLFGEGKLIRTAEVVKLAIRSSSFNAMYPGVKFRIQAADLDETKQKEIERWTNAFVREIAPIIEEVIDKEYTKVGWADDAKHYFHYTLNKNFMNLGFPTLYQEDEDSVSQTLQKGLIKSANFEDFFFYSNRNALTKYNKKD